jgi:hypothetical protein
VGKRTVKFFLFCVVLLFFVATIEHAYQYRQPYSKSSILKVKVSHLRTIKARKHGSFFIAVKDRHLLALGPRAENVFNENPHVCTIFEFHAFQNKSPPFQLS